MIISSFYKDVLNDYEKSLDVFFDSDTGAVFEPGRENGIPKFLFTEVTGYAILDFLTLYSITGNSSYVDKAIKSAEWIRDSAQDPTGGVLTRYYFDQDEEPELTDWSFAGRRIFIFDVGICLRGMVAIAELKNDDSLLDSAIRMGDFLVDKVINDQGEVVAIYDAKNECAIDPVPEKWSRCFGAFHSKVAEALADLYKVTNNKKYLDAATSVCNKVLQFQSESGNFETSKGVTELHPHCYATEGLLHVGRIIRSDKLIDAAHKATTWAIDQFKDNEIPQSFDFKTSAPLSRFRTDAMAQVLALASDLLQMGKLDKKYKKTLDAIAEKIQQMKSGPEGYYQYGYYEREINGKIEANTRCYWANMFCMRGLSKYYQSYLIDNTYVALLAGGIGSRVWPISCENRPKPVSFSLLGDHSLLQETIRRYTDDYFVKPEQIIILCSKNALQQVTDQAEEEGVPRGNCVLEKEPKGTIPAVSLALGGLPEKNKDAERFVIVTMADNVIDPFESFQNAVMAGLFTVREQDCLVSVGKPFDKDKEMDHRFGHLIYQNGVDTYRTYKVDKFAEKPDLDAFNKLKKLPGKMAWECGTVIFREDYYNKFVPKNPDSGNLAENLLSKATEWADQNDGLQLATSLLTPETRFEDFGVPGVSVKKFYSGDSKYDFGDGNICLGEPEKIKILCSSNNLVISDELPIEIYGLEGFVVIDNSITNTAVILPIEEVHHLPGLYRLFTGSQGYEAFIKGGPNAQKAEPTTFVEKSPNAHAKSEYGLVFAYNFDEGITIERTREGLKIINEDLLEIDQVDFQNLLEKQASDSKLVQHLVHVGTLADEIASSDLSLSSTARNILKNICLYHAIGGQLTDEGEKQEKSVIEAFKKVSGLNRRILDTKIIYELVSNYQSDVLIDEHTMSGLLNENVSSALGFISKRKIDDRDIRDIVIALIQVQDNPQLFSAIKQDLEYINAGEIDRIFTCFKIAQHFTNGRWLWKRLKHQSSNSDGTRLLKYNCGRLEDIPFILAFTIEWLKIADIEPTIYINHINNILVKRNNRFFNILIKLQEQESLLLCDEIYINLISEGENSIEELRDHIENGFLNLMNADDEKYQLTQLIKLPNILKNIKPYADNLTFRNIDDVNEIVIDIYHKNWKQLEPIVSKELLTSLVH